MDLHKEDIIKHAYAAFNARDIDAVFLVLHPDVQWSNGWEGGYVNGHEEVKDYWLRQWKALNPIVEPVSIKERQEGTIEVEVHQTVKDMQNNLLFDGMVKHIYTMQNGFITKMDIEKE